MLSIVNYGASDSESESDDDARSTVISKETNKAEIVEGSKAAESSSNKVECDRNGLAIVEESSILKDEEPTSILSSLNFSASVSDLLSGLPPPKRKRVKMTESVFNEFLLPKKLTSLTGSSKKAKSGSENEKESDDSDVDEDAQSSDLKSAKVSNLKTPVIASDAPEAAQFSNPLLCSLPKAKTSIDLKKSQIMVPDSVKNRKRLAGTNQSTEKSSNTKITTSESVNEECDSQEQKTSESAEPVSYFNLSESEPHSSRSLTNGFFSDPSASENKNSWTESYYDDEVSPEETSASYDQVSNSSTLSMSNATVSSNLDSEVLQRLQGRRKKENIEIVDVNAKDQLEDVSIQITKGLSEEQEQTTGFGPGQQGDKGDPTQRRAKSKHQLNWLVTQAKAREVQLKNQWADNRMNRKATQMKYGF